MTNFTFVSHKGARPEKSELVKAHVMRESQRKRREARQKAQNQTISLANQEQRPTTANNPNELALSFSQFPTSTISHHASSQSICPRIDSAASYVPGASFGYMDNSALTSESMGLECPDYSFVQFNSCHEGISIDTIRGEPYSRCFGLGGENDPSGLPWVSNGLMEQIDKLHDYYSKSVCFQNPELPTVTPLLNQPNQVDTNPLRDSSLFWCAYRDAMRRLTMGDHEHNINDSFNIHETGVSDTDLASAMSLCVYGTLRGDAVVPQLLRIRKMLDLRGGINLHLGKKSLIGEMTLLQDMMHATCSNVPPTMFNVKGPILRDAVLLNVENWYPQSPLRVLNDAAFSRPIPELRSSFSVLKDAFDAFEMLCLEAFDPDTAIAEHETFQIRRGSYWINLGIGNTATEHDEISPMLEDRIEECVRLAARIHYRAVVLRIQHSDVANERDMKRLFVIAKKIDPLVWKVAHYVYLWILMTAGAAASNHCSERAHFVSEILRIGMSIGFFDWQSFRKNMQNFLWLQQFLRQQGLHQSTNARREYL